MTTKRRREQPSFPLPRTRIRGRTRGFETVWTLDRFTEVIRNEVSKGVARAWPPDRIRAWIRTAYELDPRSLPYASEAIDTVLGMFGLGEPEKEPPPARGVARKATTAPPRTSSPRRTASGPRAH